MADDSTPGGELGICLGIIFIIGGILMISGGDDGGGITMAVTGYHSASEIGAEGLLAVFIGIVGLICGVSEEIRDRMKLRNKGHAEINDIALNSSSSRERSLAISKTDDIRTLVRIARTDSDSYNRKRALKRLTELTDDERTLADLLISTEFSPDLTKDTIKRIHNQDLLTKIARKSIHYYTRLFAAERIKDETVLGELAKSETNFHRAQSFYNLISDEHVLADIAKTTTDTKVLGDILIKKVKNEAILTDIAKTTLLYHERGIEKMFKRIHDPALLADIARNAANYRLRMDAIEKVRDESVLIDIVKNDSYKVKKDMFTRDAGEKKERVTVYEYPVREKANQKLKGGYESYCIEEKVSSIVHID